MADQEILIKAILEVVLGQKALLSYFDWLDNKHLPNKFKEHSVWIDNIFFELQGDKLGNEQKRRKLLRPDAYFGGTYNFIFEFDEVQHFSTLRFQTLDKYQSYFPLSFSLEDWKSYCKQNSLKADRSFAHGRPRDFNFKGGRMAQRAYFDCCRDILPPLYGLNPTLRICEFEVADVHINNNEACKKIEQLLKQKLITLISK